MTIQTIDTATDIGLKTGADKYNANFTDPANMASRLAQTSPTDSTAGRGLIVGAFGVGAISEMPASCNDAPMGWSWGIGNIQTDMPTTAGEGFIVQVRYSDSLSSARTQVAISLSTGRTYTRVGSGASWSEWDVNFNGSNYQPEIADGLNVAKEMRNLSGATITAGAAIAGTSLRFGEIDINGTWTDVASSDGTYINVTKAPIGANKRGTFTKVSN